MNKTCSILVLNYNGKELLRKYLPSVVEAVEHDGNNHEIVVVDNASTDGSADFVEKQFPSVKVRRMGKNLRFYSYNDVVAECNSDLVILLNNDVKVDKNYLKPLIERFADPDVFGVMPLIDSDKPWEKYIYRCAGEFKCGTLGSGRSLQLAGGGYSLYIHCASCYDRKKFLEIGSFDWLFWPEYGPEFDISYRAWKRGWKLLFEPDSRVFHEGGLTLNNQFSEQKRNAMGMETNMKIVLKNFSSPGILVNFFLWSFLRFAKSILRRNAFGLRAFYNVVVALPKIVRSRLKARRHCKIGDREVLRIIRQNGVLN